MKYSSSIPIIQSRHKCCRRVVTSITACRSLFGSVHWTLKQYSSITSDDNHPYFFVIFSLFCWYFSFSIAGLSIFGNVPLTLKTMPNMVTNHPPFFPIFLADSFAILLLFFIQHSHNFIFGNVHWTLTTMPNMVTNHSLFFLFFSFLIFSLFYCYFSFSIATTHNAQDGHQTSPIFPLFFSDFSSLFFCYFSFSIATPSILGTAH